VINPAMLDDMAEVCRTVEPLHLGGALIEVDTTGGVDMEALAAWVDRACSG
jgi:hypothetical protein